MIKVLFICLGNICRSPTAEGVLKHLLIEQNLDKKISVDSAGTGDWHVGEAPDLRATAAANMRGINISELRARVVTAADFNHFDYILAMDTNNLQALKKLAPTGCRAELSLLLDYAPQLQQSEVPDPYYGGGDGFDLVLDLVTTAAQEFISHILKQHTL